MKTPNYRRDGHDITRIAAAQAKRARRRTRNAFLHLRGGFR